MKPGKKPRKSPGAYLREVWSELKKVTWPTRKELITYTIAVFVFVIIFTIILGGVDYVLHTALQFIVSL